MRWLLNINSKLHKFVEELTELTEDKNLYVKIYYRDHVRANLATGKYCSVAFI